MTAEDQQLASKLVEDLANAFGQVLGTVGKGVVQSVGKDVANFLPAGAKGRVALVELVEMAK